MFATDYPHWDGDSPDHAMPPLPPRLARRVFFDNAVDLCGLHGAATAGAQAAATRDRAVADATTQHRRGSMEQRRFGDSDLTCSALGFGTWELSTTDYGQYRRQGSAARSAGGDRSRHHAVRHRRVVWPVSLGGAARQGAREPALGRRAGDQGRVRLRRQPAHRRKTHPSVTS